MSLNQVSTNRVCERRRHDVMLSTSLGRSGTLALLLPDHSSQRDTSGPRPRLLVSPSSDPAVSVGCFQPDLLRLSRSGRPRRKPPEQERLLPDLFVQPSSQTSERTYLQRRNGSSPIPAAVPWCRCRVPSDGRSDVSPASSRSSSDHMTFSPSTIMFPQEQ